jgi:hypothetical protein
LHEPFHARSRVRGASPTPRDAASARFDAVPCQIGKRATLCF